MNRVNQGFVVIPPIVGHTPRTTTGLRSHLGISQHDWKLINPYREVQPGLGYPLSLVAPLPGLQKRRQRFVDQIRPEEEVARLIAKIKVLRNEGYGQVFAVTWSLGSWFALRAAKVEEGILDGIIGISPVTDWPGQGAPECAIMIPLAPSLLIAGDQDQELPFIVNLLETWSESPTTSVKILRGAAHSFDQRVLRERGRMQNPDFNRQAKKEAETAIQEFLNGFRSPSPAA